MSIVIRDVTKTFGDFTAIKKVRLVVPEGELVALLGPSGSGKTTLLRIVAGLEIPDQGDVVFFGDETKSSRVHERGVGFVFQHYALFRHMTVFENVAFGLRVRPRSERPKEKQIREKVRELLRLVQLERLALRYPAQLSGGQRQRVALARALAVEPKILLLDEPFGALDSKVRKELRHWLRHLHDEIHITSIFVTHDQEDALEVADRVVVMNEGRIEQVGTPEEIYHEPASPFVYDFLGNVNLFRGHIENGKAHVGNVTMEIPPFLQSDSKPARIYIRPHSLEISRESKGANYFRARVQRINPSGPFVKVDLVTEWGAPLHVQISQDSYRILDLKQSDDVFVTPKEKRIFFD